MKKIFLIYGHYDDKSFNAAIRDAFIKTAEEKGHSVDAIDLYKEKFDPVLLEKNLMILFWIIEKELRLVIQ